MPPTGTILMKLPPDCNWQARGRRRSCRKYSKRGALLEQEESSSVGELGCSFPEATHLTCPVDVRFFRHHELLSARATGVRGAASGTLRLTARWLTFLSSMADDQTAGRAAEGGAAVAVSDDAEAVPLDTAAEPLQEEIEEAKLAYESPGNSPEGHQQASHRSRAVNGETAEAHTPEEDRHVALGSVQAREEAQQQRSASPPARSSSDERGRSPVRSRYGQIFNKYFHRSFTVCPIIRRTPRQLKPTLSVIFRCAYCCTQEPSCSAAAHPD